MKLIGWYEDADFLGEYKLRDVGKFADNIFCIRAGRAFEIAPEDRPSFDHGRQFGSMRIGWLRGRSTNTDWTRVRGILEELIQSLKAKADQPGIDGTKLGPIRVGDTSHVIANVEVAVDDGGEMYGRVPGGESPEHRELREWARDNPDKFGIRPDLGLKAATEYPLPSGDRIDAVHIGERNALLIEAKSHRSGEADMERGIFQCVKYRAVFLAMNDAPPPDGVETILLTQRHLSPRLEALAKRLKVTTKIQSEMK
ncbi:hypothetical protein B2G71_23060 [Novosphingobium sp. PC22D]|nr:hypothetical protein B2G71_23060 [Novosphingobium sp. PC22D]